MSSLREEKNQALVLKSSEMVDLDMKVNTFSGSALMNFHVAALSSRVWV